MVFGEPRVGTPCNVVHETGLPGALGVEAIALYEAPLPLPIFDGFLLVDPVTMVLEVQFTDGDGRMQRAWPVPADPGLVGAVLCCQGVAFAADGRDAFATAARLVIGP